MKHGPIERVRDPKIRVLSRPHGAFSSFGEYLQKRAKRTERTPPINCKRVGKPKSGYSA